MKTIGDRIKEQRILMGITQEELGRIASVSKVTIHKYETNVITNIPSDRIEIIAKALNVKPAYLMGWSDENMGKEDYSEDTIVLARKLGTLDDSQIQLINQMINEFERNKDKDHE